MKQKPRGTWLTRGQGRVSKGEMASFPWRMSESKEQSRSAAADCSIKGWEGGSFQVGSSTAQEPPTLDRAHARTSTSGSPACPNFRGPVSHHPFPCISG